MATYIQTPNGLYPIGGQVTKNKIINALGYTPSAFDGDYNSLNNKPSIVDDGSDIFYIADTQGNIIFKVDSNGIHSVNLILNGKTINQVIKENTPSGDYNDLENKPEIIEDGSAELSIVDSQGNIVAKITSEGIQAVNFLVGEAKDKVALAKDVPAEVSLEEVNNKISEIEKNISNAVDNSNTASSIAEDASSKADTAITTAQSKADSTHTHSFDDLDNKPNITEDETGKLSFCDASGNIIMEIDAAGLNVFDIKVNGTSLTDIIASEVARQLSSK